MNRVKRSASGNPAKTPLLAVPKALPALEEAARRFGRFLVRSEETYRLADAADVGAELVALRSDPTAWCAHARRRLVDPWLVFDSLSDRPQTALGRVDSVLEVFARYDCARRPNDVRVPHPYHLALVGAEAPLPTELRPVLRHWAGRAIRFRVEHDASVRGEPLPTDSELASATQRYVTRISDLDAGKSQIVPRSLAERVACRWLATLGPLAWVHRGAAQGSPARGLVQDEEYRAVAAFYGAMSMRSAVHGLTGHLILDEGLRDAFGGAMRLYEGQGIVTLIRGGPGAGKTSLAVAHAAAAVLEGGCGVVISLEETRDALRAKFAGLIPHVSLSDIDEWVRQGYLWLIGTDREGDDTELDALVREVDGTVAQALQRWQEAGRSAASHAPLCVVVDSLTALLIGPHGASPSRRDPHLDAREAVFRLVQRWRRERAITVIVAGSEPRQAAEQAEYLADNVFVLEANGVDRSLRIQKSRLQATSPEPHMLHISRDGVRVFPGGASAAKRSSSRAVVPVSRTTLVPLTWMDVPATQGGAAARRYLQCVAEGTHITVFGVGSTRKANYGLTLLLSTPARAAEGRLARVVMNAQPSLPFGERPRRSTREVQGRVFDAPLRGSASVDETRRVHVISFLHGQDNYRAIVRALLERRGDLDGQRVSDLAASLVRTTVFHPGQLDPSVLIRKVERALDARPDGLSPTGVLLDGIHNALVTLPRVAGAPWVWNEIAALCAERGATLVSTFSLMSTALRAIGLDHESGSDALPRGHEGALLARSSTTVAFKDLQGDGRVIAEVPIHRDLEGLRDLRLVWDASTVSFTPEAESWALHFVPEARRAAAAAEESSPRLFPESASTEPGPAR